MIKLINVCISTSTENMTALSLNEAIPALCKVQTLSWKCYKEKR